MKVQKVAPWITCKRWNNQRQTNLCSAISRGYNSTYKTYNWLQLPTWWKPQILPIESTQPNLTLQLSVVALIQLAHLGSLSNLVRYFLVYEYVPPEKEHRHLPKNSPWNAIGHKEQWNFPSKASLDWRPSLEIPRSNPCWFGWTAHVPIWKRKQNINNWTIIPKKQGKKSEMFEVYFTLFFFELCASTVASTLPSNIARILVSRAQSEGICHKFKGAWTC